MPYFAVILEGEGISVPSVDSDEEIVGFYTFRWVKAQNVEQAKEAAAHLVMDDWTLGQYAIVNRGNPPRILVDHSPSPCGLSATLTNDRWSVAGDPERIFALRCL